MKGFTLMKTGMETGMETAAKAKTRLFTQHEIVELEEVVVNGVTCIQTYEISLICGGTGRGFFDETIAGRP